jgi:hypothetical protein
VYIKDGKGYYTYPRSRGVQLHELVAYVQSGVYRELQPIAAPLPSWPPALTTVLLDHGEALVLDLIALRDYPYGLVALVLATMLAGCVTAGIFMAWLLSPSSSSPANSRSLPTEQRQQTHHTKKQKDD